MKYSTRNGSLTSSLSKRRMVKSYYVLTFVIWIMHVPRMIFHYPSLRSWLTPLLVMKLYFSWMVLQVTTKFEWILRKIPYLLQANTSYYQVYKIWPITKLHVLFLGFAITTQKPTKIYQVSCKNQSHISTCKRWHKRSNTCKQWHMQPSTCKRWHKRTNQAMTCVTNQTPPRVAHPPLNSYK